MMTVERKIIVGAEDIRAVIFECVVCSARVFTPLENFNFVPDQCPYGHTWQHGDGPKFSGSAARVLADSLKGLRNSLYERTGFKVFLELDEPKP